MSLLIVLGYPIPILNHDILASRLNYSGKAMIHCHDLMHEDVDMICWVKTVVGPENLPPQEQASCDAVRKQAKGKKGNGKNINGKGKGKKGVVG